MKVRILLKHGKWITSHTGKGLFITSLVPRLENLGIKITDDINEGVDIDFQISRWHYTPTNCRKTIIRLGPAHVDTEKNHKWLNDRKAKSAKKVDGIIYQSEFGKIMCDRHLLKPKRKWTIINNGADIEYYDSLSKATSPYKHNYIVSSQDWLKQKRLKDVIKSFKIADVPDSCLWIAGYADKYHKYARDNIVFLGMIDKATLGSYYRLCDAQVHMVWLDCMPNAVCEALAAGCRVICNNTCGTAEIVARAGGIVLSTDPVWNLEPVNINKPPKVDRPFLARAIRGVLDFPPPNRDCVDIRKIAVKYAEFFEEVLK